MSSAAIDTKTRGDDVVDNTSRKERTLVAVDKHVGNVLEIIPPLTNATLRTSPARATRGILTDLREVQNYQTHHHHRGASSASLTWFRRRHLPLGCLKPPIVG